MTRVEFCTGQEEKCGFHPSPQDETVKTPSGISLYEVTLQTVPNSTLVLEIEKY